MLDNDVFLTVIFAYIIIIIILNYSWYSKYEE